MVVSQEPRPVSLPHPLRATVLFSALFSPPAEQGGWPLVSSFTKPESWGEGALR